MATTIETYLKEVLGDMQKELTEIRGDLNPHSAGNHMSKYTYSGIQSYEGQ